MILFIGPTILFSLTFTLIYNIFSKKNFNFSKIANLKQTLNRFVDKREKIHTPSLREKERTHSTFVQERINMMKERATRRQKGEKREKEKQVVTLERESFNL